MVAESTVVDALRHGELLAPGIDRVLTEAGARPTDITRIAVGVGPGPFTGLRVGIVTARIMGYALQVPVDGVCTLDVVAAAVRSDGRPFVCRDRRAAQGGVLGPLRRLRPAPERARGRPAGRRRLRRRR